MDVTQTMTITVTQRNTPKKGAWLEAEVYANSERLHGKSMREDIVDGQRYLAIRWVGNGIATYIHTGEVVNTPDRITFRECKLIHWGL